MNFLLKLLKAKKHNEIRNGKLWEVTRLWGMDISTVEQEIPKADERKPVQGGDVVGGRVHSVLGSENNVTNITKNPELL